MSRSQASDAGEPPATPDPLNFALLTGDLVGQAGWLQFESAPSPTCDATGAFAPGGDVVQAQRPATADPSLQTATWTISSIFSIPGTLGDDVGEAIIGIGLGAFGYAFNLHVLSFPFFDTAEFEVLASAPGVPAFSLGTMTLDTTTAHTLTLALADGTLSLGVDGGMPATADFVPSDLPSDLGMLLTWDGQTTENPVHVARLAFLPL